MRRMRAACSRADPAPTGGEPRPVRAAAILALLAVLAAVGPAGAEGFTLLAAPGFEAAGDAFGGSVPLRQDGLWGVMAGDGTWAAKPAFQDAGPSGKGRLPVEKDNLWGVIDAQGKIVTPFAFQAIGRVADWTPMRWKGQWWAVGPDGRPEGQPLPFDSLIGNDGTCMVGKAGGVPVAVNRGRTASATMLASEDEMAAPSDGFVPIRQNGLAGHMDCAWGTVVGGTVEAQAVGGFHEGWAARQGPQGWGFGTVYDNRMALGGTWAAAGDFAEGLAAVQEAGGAWGYVDPTGAWAIPPAFEAAGRFSDGMAPARQDGQWGFIGKRGQWLVPPQFQAVKAASQGVAAVESGGTWGVIAVPPLRIAAQALPLAGPLQAALHAAAGLLSPQAACRSHVLPPGTGLAATPGGAAAAPLSTTAALAICLGRRQDGQVEVLRGGESLGWVSEAVPLPVQ